MIGAILNAILTEAKAFCQSIQEEGKQAGTVLFKTNYRPKDTPSYGMPLVLIEINDSPGMSQYMGGAKRGDWVFGFNCYNYEPDAAVDDPSGYSTELTSFLDRIYDHFCTPPNAGLWLTSNMSGIEQAYSFKLTGMQCVPADLLETQDGTLMGWKAMFDSIGIDVSTYQAPYSTSPLQTIAQNDNDIYTRLPDVGPSIVLSMANNTAVPIAADTWVNDIALFYTGGLPTVSIGLTPGGSELYGPMQFPPSPGFQPVTTQQYFAASSPLYFTITGGTLIARINYTPNYRSQANNPNA